MNIIVKILSPILSAIVLGILLTSGSEYFLSALWVSLPVFIVIGTLFSVTIDYKLDKRKLNNKFNKYLISFGLYGLGGMVIITVFSLIQGSISEISLLPILLLGAVPGLIYFHISLLLTTLLKRIAN
ncbi:hypothetical protein [Ornithinibacillus californiensis]|uniref:hypothetical protein n=1 Tax=Ornithinibacillus californiensis TaxID=161536 RepID=UPI00064DD892|nr:hypothetical protein [Ornithinibacillus californiensis]